MEAEGAGAAESQPPPKAQLQPQRPAGGAAGGADARWWLSDDEAESGSEGEEEAPPAAAAGDGDELYDDTLDDKDDAWATKQRHGHESDAILSCPCCLETLCLDCQKHARYHAQFRAMFVRNCHVNRAEQLRAAPPTGRRTRGAEGDEALQLPRGIEPGDGVFYPVHCGTCNTQVGVFDADEVYHFFNVVATTA